MLFWLKKVIGYWLMPLPFSLGLIAAGVFLTRFTRRRGLGRGLAVAGGLWLLACSNAGVGTWLVQGLEGKFPAQPPLLDNTLLPSPLARCEFVAVLGGGHTYVPGWPANSQLSSATLARIVEGVRLVRRMPQARLIVCGPVNDRVGGPSHARMLADVAVSLGVPRERILEVDAVRDTEDEAVAIRALAGDKPVALVTSAWHLPRAMRLCGGQKIDAVPCPADYSAPTDRLIKADFLRWNLGGLERSTKAVYEHIGATWSRLRGKG
jgi:uncharacterized SAM-binding protein YcdF (DUF218 family)